MSGRQEHTSKGSDTNAAGRKLRSSDMAATIQAFQIGRFDDFADELVHIRGVDSRTRQNTVLTSIHAPLNDVQNRVYSNPLYFA
jgi:hypothetical protein